MLTASLTNFPASVTKDMRFAGPINQGLSPEDRPHDLYSHIQASSFCAMRAAEALQAAFVSPFRHNLTVSRHGHVSSPPKRSHQFVRKWTLHVECGAVKNPSFHVLKEPTVAKNEESSIPPFTLSLPRADLFLLRDLLTVSATKQSRNCKKLSCVGRLPAS